jgi:hypothetical protein
MSFHVMVHRSGTHRLVHETEVERYFRSGLWGLPAGSRLPMIGRDGRAGYVASDHVDQAFNQGERVLRQHEVDYIRWHNRLRAAFHSYPHAGAALRGPR